MNSKDPILIVRGIHPQKDFNTHFINQNILTELETFPISHRNKLTQC